MSTRVRLTYPPTAQFSNPACFQQSFLQIKECNTGKACPSYVWRSPSGAITSADTNYTLTSPQVAAWPILAVCKFSDWRWSRSPCSSPCGIGTRVMIRDFIGAGSYSILCGPMSRVYACDAGSCTSYALIDDIVSKLGLAVGILCIALLSCLPPVAMHACITRWCPARLKEFKRQPYPIESLSDIPEPQNKQMRARSQTVSTATSHASSSPWGPRIQAYPREYFMDGKAQGHFIVREPNKPKQEHTDPAHTQQVVESIMVRELVLNLFCIA